MQARNYQLKVLKSAISTNTIAFLPTGAGKTLIAILLIEHYMRKVSSNGDQDGKVIVFVAPTKLLLHQQEAAIEKLCPVDLEVRARCYTQDSASTDGSTVNFLSKTFWEKQLRTYNIFLCIPEIFRAILEKKLVSPSDFSLVVIDECHNAFGDSSMCVMCELLHDHESNNVIKNPRIRILGLTASPVTTKESTAVDSISRLEEITKCTLIYPKEMSGEIQLYFKPPKLQVLQHAELNLNCLHSDTPLVDSVSKQGLPLLSLVYSQMNRVCAMMRPYPAFRSHAKVESVQDSIIMLLHSYVRMTYCEMVQNTLKMGYEYGILSDDSPPTQWTCHGIVVEIQQILAREKSASAGLHKKESVGGAMDAVVVPIPVMNTSSVPASFRKPIACVTKRDVGNLMAIAEECGFLFAIDSYIHILSASLKSVTSTAESHSDESENTESSAARPNGGKNTRKTTLVDVTKLLAQVIEMDGLTPFAEQDLMNSCKVQIVSMVEVFYAFSSALEKEHRIRSVAKLDTRIKELHLKYVLPVWESMQKNACTNTVAVPTVDLENYLDFSMFAFPSGDDLNLSEEVIWEGEDNTTSRRSIPDKVILLFNMFIMIRKILKDLNFTEPGLKRKREWERMLLKTPYFCGSNGIFDVYYRSKCGQYPSGVTDKESGMPYGHGVEHYAFRTNSTDPLTTIDNCVNECSSFLIMLSTTLQQTCSILLDTAPFGAIQEQLKAKDVRTVLRDVIDTVEEMEATGLVVKPTVPTSGAGSTTNNAPKPVSAPPPPSFEPTPTLPPVRESALSNSHVFRKELNSREITDVQPKRVIDSLSLMISPKVMALFGILLQLAVEDSTSLLQSLGHNADIPRDHPKWRSIVFIKTRMMAVSLSRMLKLIKRHQSPDTGKVFDGIRPVVLIGREKQSNQVSVVEEFKQGTYNILFATSVAEEGIDVQACNCVINFDAVLTTKCFIQRRGRARAKNGCMITLVPANQYNVDADMVNGGELSKRATVIVKGLQQFIKSEAEMQKVGGSSTPIVKREVEEGEEMECGLAGCDMKAIRESDWFQAASTVKGADGASSIGRYFLSDVAGINENGSKGSFYLGYEVFATKARCDTRSAVSLFNQYCNSQHLEFVYSVDSSKGLQKDRKFRYNLKMCSDSEVFRNYHDYYADDSKGLAREFPGGEYVMNKASSGYLSNKRLCKSICSLRCVQLLHASGQLDDYLSPSSTVKTRAALERLRLSLSKAFYSGKIDRASDVAMEGGGVFNMDHQRKIRFKTVPTVMLALPGETTCYETLFLYRFKHLKYHHDSKWSRNPSSQDPAEGTEFNAAECKCEVNAEAAMVVDSETKEYYDAVKERLANFGISKCSYCQMHAANIYDNMGVAYLKKLPEDVLGLPIAIRETDMCLEYIGEKKVSEEEMLCMQSFHRAVLGWQCDEFSAVTPGQIVTPEEWSKSSNGLWYCIFPVVHDEAEASFLEELRQKAFDAQSLIRNLLLCGFMVKFQEDEKYQHVVRATRSLLPPLLDRHQADILGTVRQKLLCRGYQELYMSIPDYKRDTTSLYEDMVAQWGTGRWDAAEVGSLDDASIEQFLDECAKNAPQPVELSEEEEYALLLEEEVRVTATGLPCRDVHFNTFMGNFKKTKNKGDMYLVDPVTLLPLLSEEVTSSKTRLTSSEMDKKLFQELGHALRKTAFKSNATIPVSDPDDPSADVLTDSLSFVKSMHSAVVGEFSRRQKRKIAFSMVTFAEYYLNSGKVKPMDEERNYILDNFDYPMISVRALSGNYTLLPWCYSMIVNETELTSAERDGRQPRNSKKKMQGAVKEGSSATDHRGRGEKKRFDTHDHVTHHIYPHHCRILGDSKWLFMGLLAPPILWKIQGYVHAHETREAIYSRMKLPLYKEISSWSEKVRIGTKQNQDNECLKPDLEMFLSSISPRMLHEPSNAERLEYLGDVVLKAIVSVELYLKLSTADEHILTLERTKLISNLHLYRVGISSGIGNTLRAVLLSHGTQKLSALPPGLVSNACMDMHENPLFAWREGTEPSSEVLLNEIESDRSSLMTRAPNSLYMWAFDDEDISNSYHTIFGRNFICVRQVPRKTARVCENELLSDVAKQRNELLELRQLEGVQIDVEISSLENSGAPEIQIQENSMDVGHELINIKPKFVSDMMESLLGVYFLHGNYDFYEGNDKDTTNIGVEAGTHFLKSMGFIAIDPNPMDIPENEPETGPISDTIADAELVSQSNGVSTTTNRNIHTNESIRSLLYQVVPETMDLPANEIAKQNSIFSDFCVRIRKPSVLPTGPFSYQNYSKLYPMRFLSYDLTCDGLFAHDYHFNVSEIQRIFGYRFRNYSLLLEALTHNSCIGSAASIPAGCIGGSYERLEYLGDAVLDLIVSNYLFKGLPDAQEGLLSAAKVSMVENKSLGGASQRLGLYLLLYIKDPLLRSSLRKIYSAEISTSTNNCGGSEDASGNASVDDYEESLSEMPAFAMKTLADVFEALIGAIFIDSNKDYAVVNKAVSKSLRLNERIQHIQEVCALLREDA